MSQKKFPDPPKEMINEVIGFINSFDRLADAASEVGVTVSYLSGIKTRKWPPSERLAAFCGWKVDRVWHKS